MSFFGHLGKSSSSYVALVQVHEVSPVASCEALHCVLTRGKKAQQTRMAMADGRRCVWDEVVPVLLTLYAAKSAELDKKVYTFVVQTDRSAKRGSMALGLGAAGGGGAAADARAQRLQLSVDIDLAAFAAPDTVGKEVTRSFALQGAASGAPTPSLKLTIKVAPVKKGSSAAAAADAAGGVSASASAAAAPSKQLGLHASKHSISISAVSPLAAHQAMDSFAFARTDEADGSSKAQRRPAASPSDADAGTTEKGESRGTSAQASNVYGSLEDEPSSAVTTRTARGSVSGAGGRAAGGSMRSPLSIAAAAAHSYLDLPGEGEDNVGALSRSPGRTLPSGLSIDASPSGTGGPSSRRGSVLTPAERKRRSETQIFSSIMVNEINTSAAIMHGGGAAEPMSAQLSSATPSRRTSVLAPQPPPSADSAAARRLYVSTASEHELASLARRPTVTEGSAGVQRTPLTGALGEEIALESYADFDEDDSMVALTLPQQDPNRAFAGTQELAPESVGRGGGGGDGHSDSDDAGTDAGVTSSFADRHGSLTVDDVLSPFQSGFGDATAASARSAGGAPGQGRHARRISMFTKAEGQAQLEQMLRPQQHQQGQGQQTARANSVIKNFFSSGKASTAPPDVAQALAAARGKGSARKIQTGREYGNNDSQPASAASPHTPKISDTAPASMFFSYSSGAVDPAAPAPAPMARRARQREGDQQSERSVSAISAHSTGDDLLHTGGSSIEQLSAHASRQASRSPSPSRSAGSGAGSGGGHGHTLPHGHSAPPLSSLPSHLSSSSLSLPGPSPRSAKPSFPHSSPAKHSTAHLVSRTSRTSPFSSLSKEESAKISAGQASGSGSSGGGSGSGSAGGTLVVPDGSVEAGSLASYRAAMKHRKMKSSSRSSSSTPYGSLQLQNESAAAAQLAQAQQAASRTMPRAVSTSSLGAPTPPSPHPMSSPSPRSRPAAASTASSSANRSLSKEGSAALSASRPPHAAAAVSLADAAQMEREFYARTLPSVELLCDQLHIPDLFDGMAATSPRSPHANANANAHLNPSPSPQVASTAKSLWGSLKRLATPSHSSAMATAAAATAVVSPPSASSGGALSPSPSDACSPTSSGEVTFHHGVPVWSCTVLRCLDAWDAFGVSSFAGEDDATQVQRTATRSWILSSILAHVHHTGLFLCARSAAGQRQDALCFFIAHVASLIQLVEAYAKSPQAPAPFPLLEQRGDRETDATRSAAPPAAAALYERSILVPCVARAFLSHRGLVAVPQLPSESSQRVCEAARSRLRSSKRDSSGAASARDPSASPPSSPTQFPIGVHYPYSTALGVSTYAWFLSHLRAQLCAAYQCLLELTLTELELVDPTAVLAGCADAPGADGPSASGDDVGYESTLDQLLATYQKAADSLTSNRVQAALRTHLFACLFAHLNAALFNAVLASSAHMHMTCAMRLKVVCTAVRNWAHNAVTSAEDANDGGGASSGGVLERVCDAELAMCQQLAVLMLSAKRSLTLSDLADLCPALTPVALYHLLLNYRAADGENSAAVSAGAVRDQDDECTEELLEGLSNYMMQWAAPRNAGAAATAAHGSALSLFPAWAASSGASVARDDDDSDDDDDRAPVYGAHARARAAAANATSSSGGAVQSPFLDNFQPIPLPPLGSSAAAASPAPQLHLLPLSSVPVPAPLRSDPAFAFLQREGAQESLVLPVSRGGD